MITHVKGNLFTHVFSIDDKNIIIPHVCNNIGGWGAGFVLPLAKYIPLAKMRYLDWANEPMKYRHKPFKLGNTDIVIADHSCCDDEPMMLAVANMIAQNGITSKSTGERKFVNKRPIKYDALIKCMEYVGDYAVNTDSDIHCPKFGSALAGGNWDFIEDIIEDVWCDRGLSVTVYTL